MMAITALDVDLGNSSYSIAGLNGKGRVCLRRRLIRNGVARLVAKLPPCTMRMVHFTAISFALYSVSRTIG